MLVNAQTDKHEIRNTVNKTFIQTKYSLVISNLFQLASIQSMVADDFAQIFAENQTLFCRVYNTDYVSLYGPRLIEFPSKCW